MGEGEWETQASRYRKTQAQEENAQHREFRHGYCKSVAWGPTEATFVVSRAQWIKPSHRYVAHLKPM